jgi:hypothetical protein
MCSRYFLAVGVSLLSAACFDIQEVEVVRTTKVDDFEDGDQRASSASGFDEWYCNAWSTPDEQEAPTCGNSDGFESTLSEFMTFFLQELPDVDYPGAVLGTSVLVGTRDLSSFESLRFRSKFEPGHPAPPAGTRLLIELVCPSADVGGDAFAVTRYQDRREKKEGVQLTGDWSSHELLLADFEEPRWQGSLDDEGSCRKQVSAIQFVITPALLNGEAAAGTLTIDDVFLE